MSGKKQNNLAVWGLRGFKLTLGSRWCPSPRDTPNPLDPPRQQRRLKKQQAGPSRGLRLSGSALQGKGADVRVHPVANRPVSVRSGWVWLGHVGTAMDVVVFGRFREVPNLARARPIRFSRRGRRSCGARRPPALQSGFRRGGK